MIVKLKDSKKKQQAKKGGDYEKVNGSFIGNDVFNGNGRRSVCG